jgi:hypothetical protein
LSEFRLSDRFEKTDRQTSKQTKTHKNKQTNRQTDRKIQKQTNKQPNLNWSWLGKLRLPDRFEESLFEAEVGEAADRLGR